jgi:hypothetical protein
LVSSECHERYNHEGSQSNYCACLSAADSKAEFMYSAFADVKMLKTKQLLTGMKTRAQMAPIIGIGQPAVLGPFGAQTNNVEDAHVDNQYITMS